VSRKILVVADDSRAGAIYQQALGSDGYDVRFSEDPAAAVAQIAAGGFDLILVAGAAAETRAAEILGQSQATDVFTPVVVLSRNATVEAAVDAMRQGAADYLREPDDPEGLRSIVQRIQTRGPTAAAMSSHTEKPEGFEGMLGRCPAMREVFALIERIAAAESTVLVTGESGTGKEMVVRASHRRSRRRDYPLLACDCTALAPTLLESELFGHVKGSFSGAIATKKGLFEVAHQGTLFLDEVANLSLETQGKLLRVLETRQVRKVGDTAEHEVDIRLIATTNRSLAEMVKVGAFRADLYYRLNVVPIGLPPLRDRAGDIPLLATAFLEQFSRQLSVDLVGFSGEAMRQMEVYTWPGNVRELRNIVERLAVLYGGSRIEREHLPGEILEAKAAAAAGVVPQTWEEFKTVKRQMVWELEQRFLQAALDRCSRNVTQAAEIAGMQRTNFHALLRRHHLRSTSPPDD